MSREWVEHLYARLLEVTRVSRNDDEAVNECSRRDQTILDRQGSAGPAQLGKEFCPAKARPRVPWNANDSCNTRIKPGFESATALSRGEKMNAEPNLAQNDGINHQFTLVAPQPVDCRGIGGRISGFAKDIGVDEVGHSVSVDSDSMGT